MSDKDLPPLSIIGDVRPSQRSKATLGQKSQKDKKIKRDYNKRKKKREEVTAKAEEKIETSLPAKKYASEESPIEAPKTENKSVWSFQSKVQEDFLASSEDEVLMSGGRGSGKSDVLIVDPLRYCKFSNFRGLVLRHTMNELRELIARAQDLYPSVHPGVKWKEKEKLFQFPSGAKIEFGYCDRLPQDLEQYKGQEYQWLGLDELTQWPEDTIIEKMRGSLRSTDDRIPVQIRATTNPDGVGRLWVKERYVDRAAPGKTIIDKFETPIGTLHVTKKWFHSNIYDNPLLIEKNPQYLATLHSYKGRLREVWLDGSWDAADGMAFDEFDRRIHVVSPFTIPDSWPRFAAVDWGFGDQSLAVCLWFAVDPEGCIFVYREFTANGPVPIEDKLTAPEFARRLTRIENAEGDKTSYTVVDGQTHQNIGSGAPTLYEQMRVDSRRWKFAHKAKGSRISGKQQIHSLLAVDEVLKRPQLQIFEGCTRLISELSSLAVDEKNPEDVVKKDDHAYDALRYGLTSRPESSLRWDPFQAKAAPQKPIYYC